MGNKKHKKKGKKGNSKKSCKKEAPASATTNNYSGGNDHNNSTTSDDTTHKNNILEEPERQRQIEESNVYQFDSDEEQETITESITKSNETRKQKQQQNTDGNSNDTIGKNNNNNDDNGFNAKNVHSDSTADNNNNSSSSNNNHESTTSGTILTDVPFDQLGVCESLTKACNNLGWKCATKIQEQVLPEALHGRDIIGLAETGSGKTAAFCLPMLQQLLQNPIRGAVSCVILAPTRELAFQIHQVVNALGTTIGATSVCIVGGVPMTQQSIALGRNPHIIVATPGRLLDHLQNTKGFHLRKLQYLILDEADRMLSMDFEQELNELLTLIPDKRKTMLFSATMTSKVQKLQRACLQDPVKVEVSTKFQTPKQLLQSYLFIPAKYKDCYLTYLIHEHAGQSILVFGATCNNVQRLAIMLRNLGFDAICLHGQMSQPKRLGALNKFTSGQRSILICTDVASRGLDIPHVDVVINFDLPGHGKDYIHRVGRTARAGKSGKAIAMVTQYDVEVYQRLEGLLGTKLPEYKLDEETVLVLLERVNEAQRLATREVKEQLAASANGGGRRKRKPVRGGDDGGGGDDNDLEQVVQQQIKKGYYAGGSGGRGGALPNQRGSGKQHKKHRHK